MLQPKFWIRALMGIHVQFGGVSLGKGLDCFQAGGFRSSMIEFGLAFLRSNCFCLYQNAGQANTN
jgi:hypothetical protein